MTPSHDVLDLGEAVRVGTEDVLHPPGLLEDLAHRPEESTGYFDRDMPQISFLFGFVLDIKVGPREALNSFNSPLTSGLL